MIRKVLVAVCLFSALSLLGVPTGRADVIRLKFANYMPIMHTNTIVMGKFVDEVNKKLAGRVEITMYSAGTLLTAPKMAAGVASGIADIGLSHCSYSRGRFPVMELTELPFGASSSFILTNAINDFYNKFKPKEWDAYHPLLFGASSPSTIQTLGKPVKTLEDLKGLKIRGTGRSGEIVKALGAITTPVEMMDMYESLRRGVIDGNMGPYEQLKSFRTGEVLKYHSVAWQAGSGYTFYVVANKNKWNSLPADVKQVIDETAKKYIEPWGIGYNKVDLDGLEFFKQQGGQVIPIPDAEIKRWLTAVEPVIAKYKQDMIAKGFKGEDVDAWIKFLKERIAYWTTQEKARKIPTAYN
ncbi:MAG: Monocarboxylate 2-oxoacid-binding periplasmic protein precursor [Syntrophorhabdaceae bacterium PtaU1.Bin034]|jgi:TRAP-type C4-dicarboxylate transport system substrate-binding protein|nr:MAG: Monocarboxylate 2-oxoacid-binding periplasmic protein precursor [Syntrophorhabdaceae bacterium PtaU1.Bin034]